jgi:hypothetical protein
MNSIYIIEVILSYLVGRIWRKIVEPILGNAGISLSATERFMIYGIVIIITIVGILKLNSYLRNKYIDGDGTVGR